MPVNRSDASRRAIALIMVTLAVWGIYLAIGATGLFVQRSLFDPRKSLIVVTCMGGFLLLWGIVLLYGRRKHKEAPKHVSRIWSQSGITSLLLSVSGFATWGLGIAAWNKLSASTVTILGWSAALVIMSSVVAALISLSEPQPRRGKLLGLISLLLFVVAMVAFCLRMRPF